MAPKIDGIVLAIDNDLNLVMLNIGMDAKVKVGYRFYMYRGAEYVGEVRIDRVGQDHSFGSTILANTRLPLKIGDNATTQLGLGQSKIKEKAH